MKNILVPTNFSENCKKAEELGIEMAKLYNSEIHFFHLINTPVNWVELDKEKEKRYPETVKEIGSAKASLRALEKKAEQQASANIVEKEKIDYIKYIAIQVVLGTIALIAMMIVLYMLKMDTKHIVTILVAYFPYLYIKKDAPKQLHILTWSIYVGITIFALIFR